MFGWVIIAIDPDNGEPVVVDSRVHANVHSARNVIKGMAITQNSQRDAEYFSTNAVLNDKFRLRNTQYYIQKVFIAQ